MSARNMAKRTAAGTLALAVCLGGGALAFAGAANAAPATDITAQLIADGDGVQRAVSVDAGVTSQALSSVRFTIASGQVLSVGDRFRVALSNNVQITSAGSATVKTAGSVKPVFSTSVDPADSTVAYVTVTTGGTLDAATTVDLKGLTVTTETSSGTDATIGKIDASMTYQTYGSSTYTSTERLDSNAGNSAVDAVVGTVGFVTNKNIGITTDSTQWIRNGSSYQAIKSITVQEKSVAAIPAGTASVALTFTQDDGTVTIDNVDPAGTEFDATFAATGSSTVALNTALSKTNAGGTGQSATVTVPVTSLSDSVLDGFTVSGLRIAATGTKPIHVSVVQSTISPASTVTATGTAGVQLSGLGRLASDIGVLYDSSRIGGADRYATAAYVAKRLMYGSDETTLLTGTHVATQAVLVSGEGQGVDALSASFLAGSIAQSFGTNNDQQTAVFLTAKGGVPDATMLQLKDSLGLSTDPNSTSANAGKKVFVLGGQAAISDEALGQIKAAFPGIVIARIQGGDRYETAAKAAIEGVARYGSVPTFSYKYGTAALKTAIVSSGENPVDALVAGQVSYQTHLPQLLTAKDSLPDATADAITSLGIKRVVLTGGTGAVSANVEAQLQKLGVDVVRVSGSDRYDTAAKLLNLAGDGTPTVSSTGGLGYTALNSASKAYLASGESFADALVLAPLAATRDYPAVIGAKGDLTTPTADWLKASSVSRNSVTGIGLAGALPDLVLNQANGAANG